MSYDGTILARARDRLDGVREQNAREHETRVMRAYAAKPELRAIDAALRAQMTELVRLTLSGETEKIEALREEEQKLLIEKNTEDMALARLREKREALEDSLNDLSAERVQLTQQSEEITADRKNLDADIAEIEDRRSAMEQERFWYSTPRE